MKGNNDAWEEQEKSAEENKIDGQTDTPKPYSSSAPSAGPLQAHTNAVPFWFPYWHIVITHGQRRCVVVLC